MIRRARISASWCALATLLVAAWSACTPPDGENPPPDSGTFGITVGAIHTASTKGRCFQAEITYRVLPTQPGADFAITYSWDADWFHVTGLPKSRTARRIDANGVELSEKMEVCVLRYASDVVLLPLFIEATSSSGRERVVDWFKGRASIAHVFGSERWLPKLVPETEALKDKISAGTANPYTYRQYWRLIGAMYHGGADAFSAYLSSKANDDPPSAVTGAQRKAYETLLQQNGGNVTVVFHPTTGQVTSIQLNEAYPLTAAFRSEVKQILAAAPFADLLRLSAADELQLRREEEVGNAVQLRFQRVRGGTEVVQDRVIAFVHPTKTGYVLSSLVAAIGDVGDATCEGIDRAALASRDDAVGKVWATSQYLLDLDGTYRCVYVERSTRQLPPPVDTEVGHVRILDAHSGAVLLDADNIVKDGGDRDRHFFETHLAVPYRSNPATSDLPLDWYKVPTRLPLTRAFALGPTSSPQLHTTYYDPPLDGFTPSDVIPGLSDDTQYSHQDYLYMPLFHHRPAEQPGVEPDAFDFYSADLFAGTHALNSLYPQFLDSLVSGDFRPDDSSTISSDFAIPYDLNVYDSSRMDLIYSAFTTAQAYFLVQYSRYIWGAFGDPIGGGFGSPWIDGPILHCAGDQGVFFKVVPRDFSPCPDAGACKEENSIYINADQMYGAGILPLIAHEYGHWVTNVQPHWSGAVESNNHAAARAEAMAMYFTGSLLANWQADGSMVGQYDAVDPAQRYDGNRMYSSLVADTHWNDIYANARPFAGTYLRLMDTIGAYYTDRSVPWMHYSAADHHWEGLLCGHQAEMYGTDGLGNYLLTALNEHGLLLSWDRAHELRGDNQVEENFGPNFVRRQRAEISKAAQQHDWLSMTSTEFPSRVSADPSHAHALTTGKNRPAVVNVRYTPAAPEKWVNFFASAGVRYNLFAAGSASQVIELYRVAESPQGGWPSYVAMNDRCDTPSKKRQDLNFLPYIDVSQLSHICPTQNGISQPALTFVPKRSGWFYALVKGTVEGKAAIFLEPAETQATVSSHSRGLIFDTERERRLGQALRVHMPGTPVEPVSATWRSRNEEHDWKIQHYPASRLGGYSDRGDSASVSHPFQSSDTQLHMQYAVRVTRPDNGADLTLVTRTGRHNGLITTLATPPTKTTLPGPQPGLVVDEWILDQRALNTALDNKPGEVYLRLFRSPLGNRANSRYDMLVQLRHTNLPHQRDQNDTTSFQRPGLGASYFSGTFTIPRWCAGENIELAMPSFQVAEYLSPDDADYFQVFLEEGEHLNITYRGRIPAAIDVDGPGQARGSSLTRSELNSFMVRALHSGLGDHADHFTLKPNEPRWIQDFRPVIGDPTQELCPLCTPETCCGNVAGGEYFAQRGYLWNMNRCSAQDAAQATVGVLECPNTPFHPHAPKGRYEASDTTPDNAVHLGLTAFITGLYTIRVRSQDENGVKLDGYWSWDFARYQSGAPYTLDFAFGVLPNPMRPHWQWLQPGADPAPQQACGRTPICGDGRLHPREECDDGNLINGDGCSSQCLIE